MLGAEVSFNNRAFDRIGQELTKFSGASVIPVVGGLLTIPEYQPQTLRIEVLLHLACLHCRGVREVRYRDIKRWLERYLPETGVVELEDPPEDVFVSNVIGRGGNYRIFEGTWEAADHSLQEALDCLIRTSWGAAFQNASRSAHALLALSDAVAERAELHRWEVSEETAGRKTFLRRHRQLNPLRRRVWFTFADLADLGIPLPYLGPFLFQPRSRLAIRDEVLGNSTLERYPVIRIGENLVLADPTAVSPAIRRFLLEEVGKHRQLPALADLLRKRGRQVLVEDLLPRLSAEPSGKAALPELEIGPLPNLPIDVTVTPIDTDKVAVVVLVHDDLGRLAADGFGTFPPPDLTTAEIIEQYGRVWSAEGYGGLALVVWMGLGGGRSVALPHLPSGWHSAAIGVADLDMYARVEDASLLRLWKLLQQERFVSEKGIQILGYPALLNLYSFWERQNFRLVPADVPFPSQNSAIYVSPDFLHTLRARERTSVDRHAAPLDDRTHVVVERYHRHAFFGSLKNRPIFAAPDLARRQELAAVVERQGFHCWVFASRPEASSEVAGVIFHIWQALVEWIDRVSESLLEVGPWLVPVRVRLLIPDAAEWQRFSTSAGDDPPARPIIEIEPCRSEVVVQLPFGFLTLLRRPTNDGERALLEEVFAGILRLRGESLDPNELAQRIVEAVLKGPDRRSIHLFAAQNPTDYLEVPDHHVPRMMPTEDLGTWTLGLASRTKKIDGPGLIDGRESAVECLNDLVDVVWQELEERLQRLDAESVIQAALLNNEAIFRDRAQWRRTARAVFALHEEHEDVVAVAASRESERAETALAGRILVEMAAVTSLNSGGAVASHADFDYLRAGVGVLIGLASDSDAIHGSVAEPRIEVAANGAVFRDHSFLGEVAQPYVRESYGRSYRSAAEEYDSFFRIGSDVQSSGNPYLEDTFRTAFRAEYGITPNTIFEAAGELFDMAQEQKSTLLRTTHGEVSRRLGVDRGLSADEIESFWRCLALVQRPRWNMAPRGFKNRDWYPWVYRRRLALSVRPVVVLGGESDSAVLVGMYQMGASISYLMGAVRDGWFPVDSFESDEMRQYWGEVVRARGHGFTLEVASAFASLGWSCRTEVEAATVGAPKSLGDFDLVGWREGDDRIIVVECKSLQPARTTGEIVELLNQFKGEAGDRLHKHLRRVEWLTSNIPRIQREMQIPAKSVVPIGVLVTNAEVPMQFKRDLPLSADKVVPIFELQRFLA